MTYRRTLAMDRMALFYKRLNTIKTASPYHIKGEDWMSGEAKLVWAIWVQALSDWFVIIKLPYKSKATRDAIRDDAHDTAMKGFIVKPDGNRINALELLGINPTWASEQMTEAMKVIEQYLKDKVAEEERIAKEERKARAAA